METIEYTRRYSFFAPTFTYGVTDLTPDPVTGGRWIGEVARNADNPRRWWASNRTWSGGGDLVQTFRTRWAATYALLEVARGGDPAVFGGYVCTCGESGGIPCPATVHNGQEVSS